jgi:hypothetical protein
MTTEQAPPPEQSVRDKAYHLWEQHGRPSGRDLEFWNRAAAMLAAVKPSAAKRAKPAVEKRADDKPAAKRRTKSAA